MIQVLIHNEKPEAWGFDSGSDAGVLVIDWLWGKGRTSSCVFVGY